jgi:2-polyprenyl-6-methoxyphenol hydroxylase-like FAD-dependent oxidoreductase
VERSPKVLIIGAGPTGLVLALWLKKSGIPFRIFDKAHKPGDTSRALAVQARTLEFYRQLGIEKEIIDAGILVEELIMRRKGKRIASAKLAAAGKDISPFSYLLFLSQDIHEQILNEKLAALGVIIERQSELLSFSQDAAGVTAKIKTPKGEESVNAEYLCGCDGAHSVVRHTMQSEFPGGKYEQVFYVADVLAHGDAAIGGVQVSVSTQDFCIIMPIKKLGSVRLTGIVPQEKERKENLQFSDVEEAVKRNTGLKIENINWFATYGIHHRVAEHFQQGRVFICGDAGHIHSPAGGQGMNTGIGDAVNLAWKLAAVLKGQSSKEILATYESERHAFAEILIKTTDTAFRLIASRSFFGSVWRAYILPTFFSFAVRLKKFRRLAFRTISQCRIQYRKSALSLANEGILQAGDRLPWVRNSSGDNFEVLKSLGWQIHCYGELSEEGKNKFEGINLPLHIFEWNEDARLKEILKDHFYLVRPDGYISLITRDVCTIKDFSAYPTLVLVPQLLDEGTPCDSDPRSE